MEMEPRPVPALRTGFRTNAFIALDKPTPAGGGALPVDRARSERWAMSARPPELSGLLIVIVVVAVSGPLTDAVVATDAIPTLAATACAPGLSPRTGFTK